MNSDSTNNSTIIFANNFVNNTPLTNTYMFFLRDTQNFFFLNNTVANSIQTIFKLTSSKIQISNSNFVNISCNDISFYGCFIDSFNTEISINNIFIKNAQSSMKKFMLYAIFSQIQIFNSEVIDLLAINSPSLIYFQQNNVTIINFVVKNFNKGLIWGKNSNMNIMNSFFSLGGTIHSEISSYQDKFSAVFCEECFSLNILNCEFKQIKNFFTEAGVNLHRNIFFKLVLGSSCEFE